MPPLRCLVNRTQLHQNLACTRTYAYVCVNTKIYLLRFTIAKHVAESGRQDPNEETMTTNSWCVMMTMAISET